MLNRYIFGFSIQIVSLFLRNIARKIASKIVKCKMIAMPNKKFGIWKQNILGTIYFKHELSTSTVSHQSTSKFHKKPNFVLRFIILVCQLYKEYVFRQFSRTSLFLRKVTTVICEYFSKTLRKHKDPISETVGMGSQRSVWIRKGTPFLSDF